MINFRDWFALSYGYRVTGVGSSDGHDVVGIVGQADLCCGGRCEMEDRVEQACRSREGRVFISLVCLREVTVRPERRCRRSCWRGKIFR
jgi:hypothetical protein